MNRKIVYAGQIPLAGQILETERNTMVAIAKLSEAVFGTPTVADGLACTQSTPANMVINIAPGQIYTLASLDSIGFGSLSADTTHNVMKQGMISDAITLTLTAPPTSGQSINYLIQGAISETDTDNTVLPYVNSLNPAAPFTGPNNSGTAQPTTRKVSLQISPKAGTAAATGTQTTPAPDAGFVPLYVVTVAQGATQIFQASITQHPQSPFLFKHLPELPAWVQRGEFSWAPDTGTANAIVVNLTPAPTSYAAGMKILVKKSAAANTGNVTINVNGLGAVAVLDPTGAQVGAGNMPANSIMLLGCDGSAFRFINGSITQTTISSITATSGEGVSVGGATPFPVSLNFPGLSLAPNALSNLDLFCFYDNEGAHHVTMKWVDFLAAIKASMASSLPAGLSATGLPQTFPNAQFAAISGWSARPVFTFVTSTFTGGVFTVGAGEGGLFSWGLNFWGTGSLDGTGNFNSAPHAIIVRVNVNGVQTQFDLIAFSSANDVNGASTTGHLRLQPGDVVTWDIYFSRIGIATGAAVGNFSTDSKTNLVLSRVVSA